MCPESFAKNHCIHGSPLRLFILSPLVMCGIFLQALAGQEASSAPCLGANLERVRRRGPDAFAVKYHSTNLHDGRAVRLAFASSVLHLRGPNIARQPLSSDQFILQWNGEIYPVAGGPFEV